MANMASQKFTNIARPYASAAFEYAREHQKLSQWKDFLEFAASVATNEDVARLIKNPETSSETLLKLFQDILAMHHLDGERKNFLKLIAKNHRFGVLPEISDLFNTAYAALEKISRVRVITAVPAQPEFQEKLIQGLTKRTQRDIKLDCEVDPSILGGAIIHIGDRVIDGSIRGKLNRLLQNLTG